MSTAATRPGVQAPVESLAVSAFTVACLLSWRPRTLAPLIAWT